MIFWLLLVLVSFVVAVKTYLKVTTGKCTSSRRLDGKTALITGSNTGIGKETAVNLARRGARVILVCRDLAKAEKARKDIMLKTGNPEVKVMQCDVSRLNSVRKFCEDLLNTEDRLDILVHNAGMALLGKKILTEDGLELTMATNYFGPFLMTHLLIDLLKKTVGSRVVIVSSEAYKVQLFGIDFENLNGEREDKSKRMYGMSKLAIILFGTELARRLEGTGITVNMLHPGVVKTEVFRNFPTFVKIPWMLLYYTFFKTAEEGAQTIIHLCVSEDVEGISGKYFIDCKEASTSRAAQDRNAAKKLWEVSERLCRLTSQELLKVNKLEE